MRAHTQSGAITYTQLSFEETKELMEHILTYFKEGVMPHKEREKLTRDCSMDVAIDSLDKKMNVLARGHLEADQPSGIYRCVYCRHNNTSTDESRDEQTNEIKQLVGCYSV